MFVLWRKLEHPQGTHTPMGRRPCFTLVLIFKRRVWITSQLLKPVLIFCNNGKTRLIHSFYLFISMFACTETLFTAEIADKTSHHKSVCVLALLYFICSLAFRQRLCSKNSAGSTFQQKPMLLKCWTVHVSSQL